MEEGGEWNVDGFTELTVGELTGETTYRTLAEPALLRGVRGGVVFGPDAERFAVITTGRTENANVYVVDVASGETTRWTDAVTAGIPRDSFVEYGENDPRVPVGEARQIAQEAAAHGVPVETLFFDDEGHSFTQLENRIETYSAIADFLDEHV